MNRLLSLLFLCIACACACVPTPSQDASVDVVSVDATAACPRPSRVLDQLPAPGRSVVLRAVLSPESATLSGPASGPCAIVNRGDHNYVFTVTQRSTLQFVVTSTSTEPDAGRAPDIKIALRRRCDSSDSEIACDLDSGPGAGAALRRTLEPDTYVLVVDASGIDPVIGANYELTITNVLDDLRGTCAGATNWVAGSSITGNIEHGATTHRACFSDGPTGPEVFFRYELPARTRSTVTVTPTDARWPTAIHVREDCAAITCVANGSGASTATGASSVTIDNPHATPRAFIVSARSYELGLGGLFELSDALSSLPPAAPTALCESAPMIVPDTVLTNQVADSNSEQRTSDCALTSSSSSESFAYYRVRLAAGRTLAVSVRGDRTSQPTLRLFNGCSPSECLVGETGALRYSNTTASEQELTIAVSSGSLRAAARFDLDVRLLPAVPTNTSCASAVALTPSSPALAQGQFAATAPNPHPECEPSATGNVLFYSLTVPARQAAFVQHSSYWPSRFRQPMPVLRIADSCAARACVSSTNNQVVPEAMVSNDSDAERTYVLTLGSQTTAEAGVFDLRVRFAPLASNADCSTPRALADGETAREQDTSRAADFRAESTCARELSSRSGYGRRLYYRVTVPAMRTGVFRVRPTSAMTSVIDVLSSCMPTTCDQSVRGARGEQIAAAITNSTAAERSYLVAVGDLWSAQPRSFDCSFSLAATTATNTSCALARPLAPGVDELVQNPAAATEANRLTDCVSTATGNVLYYSVAVPAGQTAVVTLRPSLPATIASILRVSDSCAAAACVASGPREVQFSNTTASTRTFIVTVGGVSPSAVAPVDVSLRLFAPPSNSTCAAATALMPGSTIAMQDSAAGGERRWDGCWLTPTRGQLSTQGPPLLFYATTVAPNATARVRVSPSNEARIDTLMVMDGCSSQMCAASSSDAPIGDREVTWRNNTSDSRTYVIAVGSTGFTGLFSITRE